MSNTRKIRCLLLTIMLILIIFVPNILISFEKIDSTKNSTENMLYPSETHATIIIDGDAQFIEGNGVRNPGAAGNATDPFIISDWIIDGGGANVACIEIKNTQAFFEIRNCTFYNATMGIKTEYSDNFTITNNSIHNLIGDDGGTGVDGEKVMGIYSLYSDNFNLTYNSFTNFSAGNGGEGYSPPANGAGEDGGEGGLAAGIYILFCTNSSVINNSISNISSGYGGRGGKGAPAPSGACHGGDGGDGGPCYGIAVGDSDDGIFDGNIFSNNSISDIFGGKGGDGGNGSIAINTWGGNGRNGGIAVGLFYSGYINTSSTNNYITNVAGGNGGDGGYGGDGGLGIANGGNGGRSGYTYGVQIISSKNVTNSWNYIFNIKTGHAGNGGNASNGGNSGDGGHGGVAYPSYGIYCSGIENISNDYNRISNISGGNGGNGGNTGVASKNGGNGASGESGIGTKFLNSVNITNVWNVIANLSSGIKGIGGIGVNPGVNGTNGTDGIDYGISLDNSNNSYFFMNSFHAANNTDNGTNNVWDNGTYGNYWSIYAGVDTSPRDHVGDTPFSINGSANSIDNKPLYYATELDQDGDGLTNGEEYVKGLDNYVTNITLADSDNDGLSDYWEWLNVTNPWDMDTDDDQLNDTEEANLGADGYRTNGSNSDTDYDNFSDYWEAQNNTNPNDAYWYSMPNLAVVSLNSSTAYLGLPFVVEFTIINNGILKAENIRIVIECDYLGIVMYNSATPFDLNVDESKHFIVDCSAVNTLGIFMINLTIDENHLINETYSSKDGSQRSNPENDNFKLSFITVIPVPNGGGSSLFDNDVIMLLTIFGIVAVVALVSILTFGLLSLGRSMKSMQEDLKGQQSASTGKKSDSILLKKEKISK